MENLSQENLAELLTLRSVKDPNGTIRYYNSVGFLHREYGPAVIYASGTMVWYKDGLKHRIDEPAVEYPEGSREWWIDGKFIRRYLS